MLPERHPRRWPLLLRDRPTSDRRAPARGIVVGLVLSAIFWAALALLLLRPGGGG